ncbi:hypothetical protein DIPPA_27312 [Diplonema papillatum]|nr:hypothetical protein DIPPA_27312 [Diplonema papillatum]
MSVAWRQLLLLGACVASTAATDCDAQFNNELAEARRQQLLITPSSDDPFPPDATDVHTPHVWFENGKAVVTVGLGTVPGHPNGPVHPNVASTDPAELHYISKLWVTDQNDKILGVATFLATQATPRLEVSLNGTTTALTGYALCNVHGYFASNSTPVPSTVGVADDDGRCLTPCFPDDVGFDDQGNCLQSQLVETDALILHKQLTGASSANTTDTGVANIVIDAERQVARFPFPSQAVNDFFTVKMIYVKNQARVVAAYTPTAYDPNEKWLEYSFYIPRDSEYLEAFFFDSKIGLHSLPRVTIPEEMRSRLLDPCGVRVCGRRRQPARCKLLEARRVDALRHHRAEVNQVDPFLPSSGDTLHLPVQKFDSGFALVTVGLGAGHPTVASEDPGEVHYIASIYVVDDESDTVVAMAEFTATSAGPPSLRFKVSQSVSSLTPFALCNKHGLFQGESAVSPYYHRDAPSFCELNVCSSNELGLDSDHQCAQFSVLKAEALRRQESSFSTTSAFPPSDSNAKHTPFITLDADSSTGKVTVGLGTVSGDPSDPTHPTTFSMDPTLLHFIELIYVEDQLGRVVAAGQLTVVDVEPAVLGFTIPTGVTHLTAFALCNQHGLFASSNLSVDGRASSLTPFESPRMCGVSACGSMAKGAQSCPLFENEKSVVISRHKLITGVVEPFPPTASNYTFEAPYVGWKTATRVVVSGDDLDYWNGRPDPSDVRYITHVFVENQDSTVIAMAMFTGTTYYDDAFEFEVPAGTTTLTAFLMYNNQGLLRGDPFVMDRTFTAVASRMLDKKSCLVEPGEIFFSPKYGPEPYCIQFAAIHGDARLWAKQLDKSVGPWSAGSKYAYTMRQMGTKFVVKIGAADGSGAPAAADGQSGGIFASPQPVTSDVRYVLVFDAAGVVIGGASYAAYGGFPNVLSFSIVEDTAELSVQFLSTTEGLIALPNITVDTSRTRGVTHTCGVSACASRPQLLHCFAFALRASEIRMQQLNHYNTPDPFRPNVSPKHTPRIETSDNETMAAVTVGTPSAPHPQVASADPATVHFISTIYVEDQDERIIAMTELSATTEAPLLSFRIPAGTTQMTAFAFCNVHGLFGSIPFNLTKAAPASGGVVECRLSGCHVDTGLPSADGSCIQFDVLRADALRRFPDPVADANPYLSVETANGSVTVRWIPSADFPITMWNGTQVGPQFLEAMYVEDQTGTIIGAGKYTWQKIVPEFTFQLPKQATSVVAYFLHTTGGLHFQKTSTVVTPAADAGDVVCGFVSCGGTKPCTRLSNMRAQMMAHAATVHNSTSGPDGDSSSAGDTSSELPAVRLVSYTNADGTLSVNASAPAAVPMLSEDAMGDSPVEWLGALYAVDQNGAVVALTGWNDPPEGGAAVLLSFSPPVGTSVVQVYAFYAGFGLVASQPHLVDTPYNAWEASCEVARAVAFVGVDDVGGGAEDNDDDFVAMVLLWGVVCLAGSLTVLGAGLVISKASQRAQRPSFTSMMEETELELSSRA